ncbi:unnamed protein product [Rotaria sp. Silwood2]|nr:unnamed protein product [Rotaria sp. Silwood2]
MSTNTTVPSIETLLNIVNTYNRYVLDLNLISKSSFYYFFLLIHPQNIHSLTLSNDERTSDQIGLFISLAHLRQFTGLCSLTVLDIDESQLNFILKRINLNLLNSFSFNISKYRNRLIETTTALPKLEFSCFDGIPKVPWPINFITKYLTTNNRLNIGDLCTILQYSPHLHTLIMSEIPKGVINNLASMCVRQLKSLSIKNLSVTINELELFLLLTPSFVYLKLIGVGQMLDGKRWEQFIGINLSELGKFEFYFDQ